MVFHIGGEQEVKEIADVLSGNGKEAPGGLRSGG